MKIRVGFGYDVHALVPDRELWLGGIKIEHTLGLCGRVDPCDLRRFTGSGQYAGYRLSFPGYGW